MSNGVRFESFRHFILTKEERLFHKWPLHHHMYLQSRNTAWKCCSWKQDCSGIWQQILRDHYVFVPLNYQDLKFKSKLLIVPTETCKAVKPATGGVCAPTAPVRTVTSCTPTLTPTHRVLCAFSVGRCRSRRGLGWTGCHSALHLLQALDLVINIDRSVRKGALITEPSSA